MSELAVIGRSGDTKVTWDRNNADEVDAARVQFRTLTAKGHTAFRVDKKGSPGVKIEEFDPTAERITLVPQMRGG